MKKILTFVCFIAFWLSHATTYTFNVELSSYTVAPTFTKTGSILVYSGGIPAESTFFASYVITGFYQTYPSSQRTQNLNYFTFETTSSTLMANIVSTFPTKYIRTEDLTGFTGELLLYYPNDYGTTHTPNLGAPISLQSFDYINVPKAWDYTLGNVNIGISDGKVLSTDAEFSGKTTYYQSTLFDPSFTLGSDSSHGTTVAAIAAAQGNNAYGMTGVCPNCKILNIPYTQLYSGLLTLAYNGARVINMSWIFTSSTEAFDPENPSGSGYIQSEQNIINEIHDLGVVLVAGAGNQNIYETAYAPDYNLYYFPASYNHVISVSGVNFKNAHIGDQQQIIGAPYNVASRYDIDLIGPSGALNYNGNFYTPFTAGVTANTQVDICAPAYQVPSYSRYLLSDPGGFYVDATSPATPYVTGTAALMLSVNTCLTPDEVEDVIQLTSKNLESNPYNVYWVGRSGSGKLETGDAVEFVSEMMSPTGMAVIDNQEFYRFNFDLQHINNKLKISQQTFKNASKANFVAKNAIEVFPGSDFKPNELGFIDLKIDQEIIVCPEEGRTVTASAAKSTPAVFATHAQIYPNPNAGNFNVKFNSDVRNVNVEIHDVFGKLIYKAFKETGTFEVNVPELSAGVYIVKLSSEGFTESIKFIRQ